MRFFIGLLFIGLGLLMTVGGAGALAFVCFLIGTVVLVTGRGRKAPEAPRPSRPAHVSVPRISAVVPSVTARGEDDVTALRMAVETLAERQDSLEQSKTLQKATTRIQHLESEVDSLRRRLERLDPTPDAQTELGVIEMAQADDPSAVDALARLLDLT